MRENKEHAVPRHVPRIAVEAVVAIAGILLLAGAIVADQSWWDRHCFRKPVAIVSLFVPSLFVRNHRR
jgi:hypothetical protein